ncbi:MAG TPA: DMT family transporter, partial [Alphaproteobacteria bacterium]|nr:DMT family transporter [Alphaproteobacteria bacterium]
MTRAAMITLVLEVGFVLAWSSGFVGARLAVEHAPASLVLFWRFVLAGILLAPFAARAGFGAHGWREIAIQAAVGTLAIAGYLAGVVKAVEFGVPAGLVALIAALQPLVTAALAGPVLGERAAPRQWLGLALGFGGVALALSGAMRLGTAPAWACLLPLAGMLSLVAATLLQKARTGPELPASVGLGIQCAVAAAIFAATAAAEGRVAPVPTAGFAVSILWVVVFSTFGGYGLYWACLKRTSATRVSSLVYFTPPVTMIWA